MKDEEAEDGINEKTDMVKLLNLPKVSIQKNNELPRHEPISGRKKKLCRRIGLGVMAILSTLIGFIFLVFGLFQSNGCSAGIFVINKYRQKHLDKSFESELKAGRKNVKSKILNIGLRRVN